MTDTSAPSLRARLRPLVLFGWSVAAVRLALEFAAPEHSMWFGVYYTMPAALLWAGLTRRFRGVRALRYALGMLCTGLLVWGLPNLVAYGLGQFLGWEHGRFAPGRTAPIADGAAMKLVSAASVAGLTSVAGTLWLLAWSLPLVALPGWVLARRERARAS